MKAILSARNVCMDFSNVRVLHNVDVDFEPAKIYGVVGENGAGKSTLMRILSGFLQPVEGEIYFEGSRVVLNPLKAKALGIILIPQELNLVESLRVYENIFLGDEMTRGFFLSKGQMIEETKRLMAQLELSIDPAVYVSQLSPAQKQMVEIIKAISKKVKVLIMDEPTSSLTDEEVLKLFQIVRNMKQKGITVIFISHRLKEVRQIAEELIVLRDGRKVYQGEVQSLSEKQIAELMVGRKLDEMFPEKPVPGTEIVLQVRNLSTVDGRVKEASFELYRGEILGFYGLVGSGRTELMEALAGIRKIKSGEVYLFGKKIQIERPQDAKKLGLVYLPEDRKNAGIVPIMEAFKNTTLMSLERFSKLLVRVRREIDVFKNYEKSFEIKVRTPWQTVGTLSGGNQQKVVISKLVETGAKIFLFDEPTRGVDVNARHQIYQIMHQMIGELGCSFVVVSSDLPEVIGLCNRVFVMRNGRIVAEVRGEDLNEKELIYHATGVKEVGAYQA
ncbi:MAG: ABC transporter related [Thermotoga sp. 50_1627]|uniref:sugar ABC transporter ATP-binding protein n=1 Tax=Pseudothermotoga sp. TaxID=2033661 RepID=UPI00076D6732|nr:MAG: ABC transporter related [Thermotoga sp. 50_64]KUK24456.1 MAG: ABC transporter related [Thermotoga sp. 50_1627]MBC7117112.1 sugar ABC transporter ATP-binding protein [Pseudothermotoga sp.]MBC7121646.1 sugar ABC transporter ATP-binding protein [Pseudothermotoga sp.]MDK2922945.1 ribose transport system ATP-binding protein [Pseudothermotoga sp.]